MTTRTAPAAAKPVWLNVTPEILASMGPDAAAAHAEARRLYDLYKAARAAAEAAITAAVSPPPGRRVAFAYQRGFAIAIVADDKPKAAAAPKQSLTDWLAAAQR